MHMSLKNRNLWIKPLCIAAISLICTPFSAPAHALDLIKSLAPEAPYIAIAENSQEEQALSFIASVTDEGLSFLSDTSLSENQKQKQFARFLNKNFDLKAIGRFALGRYWRTATPQQQREYTQLFKTMLIDVYSSRFSEYSGQSVTVIKSQARGKNDVIVNSKITGDNGPEIKLDWRVRNKNGRLKIIDVMVEGVSMAVTQRSDFASVIQRGGGDINVLLAHLEQ